MLKGVLLKNCKLNLITLSFTDELEKTETEDASIMLVNILKKRLRPDKD